MFSEKAYVGLGKVPVGIGAVLRGWDITEQEFRQGMHVVDFRAMVNACPHNCVHCFLGDNPHTLTLAQIKRIIDELAELGARGIDFVGEGEPTIDRHFFEIVEYTSAKGIIPVIFTDGATKLRDRDFIRRLKDSGASILLKGDSLFSAEYQNWVVGDKTGVYFSQRNEALELLMEAGLNEIEPDSTTRLGFDMVISSRNIHEAPEALRFCRQRNLAIFFAFFLPVGKSGSKDFDQTLRPDEQSRRQMREQVCTIDREEFAFTHKIWNNYVDMPCIERIQICGDGRVSACSGNERIIGTIQEHSLSELYQNVLYQFPQHDPTYFDGNCPYRPKT